MNRYASVIVRTWRRGGTITKGNVPGVSRKRMNVEDRHVVEEPKGHV